MNKKYLTVFGFVASNILAGTVGYIIAQQRLKDYYNNLAQEEIDEAREYIDMLHKRGEYESPEAVLKKRHPGATLTAEDKKGLPFEPADVKVVERVLEGLQYGKVGQPTPKLAGDMYRRVPRDEGAEADRDPDTPYIITVDEFMAAEMGHEQVTVTYYRGDDVLSDDADMPIEDVDRVVGQGNLDRMGHLSNDPNCLYVRNERLHIDYEIVLHQGNFAEVVHGISDEARPRKKHRK